MADTMSRTDALAKIKELEAEAEQLAREADEKARSFNEKMAEMRDLIDSLSGDFRLGDGQQPQTARPQQVAQPQAQSAFTHAPQQWATKKTAVVKKRPGRPKGSGKKAERPKGVARKKRGSPRGENEKTLREVIWEIHSQGPKQWKKWIPEIPDDAKGLKAVECARIIDSSGVWKSPTGEVSNQISGHFMNFRKEGKMRKGDNFRYEIVPGAELDGPKLNQDGNPIEE